MLIRMPVLKEIFPDARYIYIKRDPLFVAQSIYLARKKNLSDIRAEWWSVPFPGYEQMAGSPVEQQIAHQVAQLQRLIEEDLKGIDDNNIIELEYESLNLQSIRESLGSFLKATIRKGFHIDTIEMHNRNSKKLDDPTLQRLQSEMNRIFEE